MYILIDQSKDKTDYKAYKQYKDLKQLCYMNNINEQTTRNNLTSKGFYIKDNYLILKPNVIQKKSNSGGDRGNL